MMTDHVTHGVIHAHLVVKPVKARGKIMAVFRRIINLADKNDVLEFLLDDRRGVRPELCRHHLSHVATETVNALLGPEKQNVRHLEPCIRNGVEMTDATCIVIDAIVQLDGLIPVVDIGRIVKMVITRCLCRLFKIGFLLAMV